jgi:electron transfer flavoprotein alpha subunit
MSQQIFFPLQVEATKALSSWISSSEPKTGRPDLSAARVVVSGGRALKTPENFQMIEALADALGGAVGASRAAVDANMVPNDLQVCSHLSALGFFDSWLLLRGSQRYRSVKVVNNVAQP